MIRVANNQPIHDRNHRILGYYRNSSIVNCFLVQKLVYNLIWYRHTSNEGLEILE
jgi:hypothetical protein